MNARSLVTGAERLQIVQQDFMVPIRDMGDFDANYAGVFTPEAEIGAEKVGISAQFLEDAEEYHRRYADDEHFRELFVHAFEERGYVPKPNQLILDIGTGAGTNTIIPCLQLFDGCRIVATDLSPDMLRMLQSFARGRSLEHRIFPVATDAMNDFFRPSRFDVVTGAAILHHLIDPEAALRTAHRVLQPGGTAFFFEPFEGFAFLRIAFAQILEASPRMKPEVDEGVREFLAAMIEDFKIRTGTDKTAEVYRYLDDKWLFTRRYFEQAAERVGFGSLAIVPNCAHETLYRDIVLGLLQISGIEDAGLPEWAWQMIAPYDTLSPEMKWDVPPEAIVILTKN
jgi:ubiquinone/menaquinone biosynthesis C-methylase UbiE